MPLAAYVVLRTYVDMTSRGAKTALTLALHSPNLIANLVAIDNCPIELPLTPDFSEYIQTMARVEAAQVKTHSEADQLMKDAGLVRGVHIQLPGRRDTDT